MNHFAIITFLRENREKCVKIACIALILIVALSVYLINNLTGGHEIVVTASADEETTERPVVAIPEEVFIIVDIQGAVNDPGVKILSEGSRVNDAVEKAGGLTEKADTMEVNLAAKLSDGDKVYIPKESEAVKAGIVTENASAIPTSDSSGGLININTANSDQLQTLSGVGPVTAQKIIDYREKSGGFKKVEDLMKVSGIGTKTFEKLKDKITV